MKNEEQFDELIRQKAETHEAPVPADAWDNINQKKKKRRFLFVWWLLAGLLLTGSVTYIIYKELPLNNETNLAEQKPLPIVVDNNDPLSATTKKSKEIGEVEKGSAVAEQQSTLTTDSSSTRRRFSKKIIGKKKKDHPLISSGDESLANPTNKNTRQLISDQKSVSEENIAEDEVGSNTRSIVKKTVLFINKKQPSRISSRLVKQDVASDKKREQLIKPTRRALSDNVTNQAIEKTNDNEFANWGSGQAEAIVNDEQNDKTNKLSDDVAAISSSEIKADTIMNLDTSDAFMNAGSRSSDIVFAEKKFIQIDKPRTRKWWIDISATPFASISNSKAIPQLNRTTQMPGYVAEYTADKVKISQQPGVVFAIGIRKNIHKKWALGTGFAYQQIKEKISLSGTELHVSTTVVQRLGQNSSGTVLVNDTLASTTTGIRTIDALNSYTLMSVPVFAQYHLSQRKTLLVDWNVGSFINLSRKYSNSVAGSFIGQNSITIKPEGGLKVGFDIFTEIRVSKALTNSIFVFAAPGFRYNLSEYKLQGMFKYTFLHQAGLSVGVSLKL